MALHRLEPLFTLSFSQASGLTSALRLEQRHGWPDDVVAPSAIAFKDKNIIPRELSHGEIRSLVEAWGEAVKRAVRAGFDVCLPSASFGDCSVI